MNPRILPVAKQAAQMAAQILLDHQGAAAINYKEEQTQNLVTEADIAAEKAIRKTVATEFPTHEFLGEEDDCGADLTAKQLWVVDPLDGTTNYAQGIPQFCTAISFVEAGQVQVGVVLDPSRNELFHAVRGEGAWLNGQRIHVSQREHLKQCVIATGFYYDRGEMMQKTLSTIGNLFAENIRGIRRLGSAALDQCWVACGRMDGFFEYQLSPWDYAAASLIVEEAGGRCADRTGSPLSLDSGSLIVANQHIFDTLVDTVRW